MLLSEHFNIWTDVAGRLRIYWLCELLLLCDTHSKLFLITFTIPHTSLSPPYILPALKTSDSGSHCLLLCYNTADIHLRTLAGSPRNRHTAEWVTKEETHTISMLTGSLEKSPGEVWATHLYITYLHMYISILVYWLLWTEFMSHY